MNKRKASKVGGYLLATSILRSYDSEDREKILFRSRIRVIEKRFAGKAITLQQIDELCHGRTRSWRDSLIEYALEIGLLVRIMGQTERWNVYAPDRRASAQEIGTVTKSSMPVVLAEQNVHPQMKRAVRSGSTLTYMEMLKSIFLLVGFERVRFSTLNPHDHGYPDDPHWRNAFNVRLSKARTAGIIVNESRGYGRFVRERVPADWIAELDRRRAAS